MMIWNRSDLVTWTSKHFKANEFLCRDGICSRQIVDDRLLNMLEELREEVGLPLTITSGFRCANMQARLRKAGYETAVGTSSHEMGQAVDITCSDFQKLRDGAEKVFGKYSIGTAHNWLHLDIRAGGPRRWGYR